jgi:hypothetical protein
LTRPGESFIEIDVPGGAIMNISQKRMVDGELVDLGAKPSPWHYYDYPASQWVMDWDKARAARRAEVDAERSIRTNAVIVQDGITLDADLASQRNVTDKLGEIADREALADPMPAELLIWRDHDNVSHSFADQATYKAWLQALRIAIAQRGTELYVWAWTKKAQIDAATTLEELMAVDLTT